MKVKALPASATRNGLARFARKCPVRGHLGRPQDCGAEPVIPAAMTSLAEARVASDLRRDDPKCQRHCPGCAY